MKAQTKFGPHHFDPDPEAPGNCRRCPLIRANQVHSPEAVAAIEQQAAQAAEQERRRLGEHE